jgi:hypothetical protein
MQYPFCGFSQEKSITGSLPKPWSLPEAYF